MPDSASKAPSVRSAAEVVLVDGDGSGGAPQITLAELAQRLNGRPPNGSGVGSRVWRIAPGAVAEDREARPDDRIVAFKWASLRDEVRQRFLPRERAYLARLAPPLFPRPFADGMLGTNHYLLVSEWIEGRNLALDGPVVVRDLVAAERFEAFCADLVRIFERLRKAGIVHGDLWEPNVMVRDHRPVLIDFGWARETGEPPPRDNMHEPDDKEALRQMLLRLGALRRMVAPGVPFDMDRLLRS